jgi:hypothetical protein
MTMIENAELTCPDCGEKYSWQIYQTLNVSVNPEEKENLLSGKINFFHCPGCNFKAFIPIALLYHDMSNQFLVQYIPEHLLTDEYIRQNFTKDGERKYELPEFLSGNDLSFDYFQKMRIVFSMDELIRYVSFREHVNRVHSPSDPLEI